MKILRFLYRLLIYGNFYISFGAALLAVEYYTTSTQTLNLRLFLLVFFASFSLYNLQRLILTSDELGESEQQKFVISNRRLLWILTILSFIPGMILFFIELNLQQQIIFALGGLVALGYFLPGISLRKLPGLKAILVGLCWAIISGAVWWKGEWSEFPYPQFFDKFLFITALAILFDIRDYSSDKDSRTFSLPIMIGIIPAQIISGILLLASSSIQYAEGVSMLPILLTFLIGLVFVVFAREKQKENYYSIGVDGLIILRVFIIIFSQNSIL